MPTLPSLRSSAKRQQISDAARQLFLTQGYSRTSTDAIARAAGVSKQTLYVYFPGKVELLSAVIEGELEGLSAQPSHPSPPQSLDDLRAALLQFALSVTGKLMRPDAVALLRLLVGEAVHLPELRSLLRQALPAVLLTQTEQLLTACAARGLIHAPDPALGARMFVGPVMSFVALDGLFGDALPAAPSEATLEALVNLFLLTVAT
ncbi:TetR/AcrR family transcriptional regulator [Deinococcus sp.]|uniref:TetR/AcrR family transcriptional regulator n=1 Tax=Deinococcus sp. TaxID=47478 RepID=UPI003CC5549A